jgi:hypothetical protein
MEQGQKMELSMTESIEWSAQQNNETLMQIGKLFETSLEKLYKVMNISFK